MKVISIPDTFTILKIKLNYQTVTCSLTPSAFTPLWWAFIPGCVDTEGQPRMDGNHLDIPKARFSGEL